MPEKKDPAPDNVLPALHGGKRTSTGEALAVAAYVLERPELFPSLYAGLRHGDPLVRMRSAYALSKVADKRPDMLRDYKDDFLGRLADPDNSHLARACMLRTVQRLALTPIDKDLLKDLLRDFMYSDSSIVKTFSMQLLADLAEEDETLRAEVIPLIWRARDTGTPAMRARARKLLKKYCL